MIHGLIAVMGDAIASDGDSDCNVRPRHIFFFVCLFFLLTITRSRPTGRNEAIIVELKELDLGS